MLGHRALSAKLTELERKDRVDVAELATRHAELERKLEAAEKGNARPKEAAGETGQAKSGERRK